MTLWIISSFFKSILAVASSINTTLLCFKKARQMHRSCFSPTDKLSFDTFPCRPPFYMIVWYKLHSFKMFRSSSSVYLPVISKFYWKVDLIKVGSWSIIVISFLISLRGRDLMLLPSISTSPLSISVTLSKVLMIVVFPAPVRPTIPIFYPWLMLQVNPLSTRGKSLRYLTFVSIN
jgi:hypothetical protein